MPEKETGKYDYLYICTRAQSSTFILSETNGFARCILVVIIVVLVIPAMVYVVSKTRTINGSWTSMCIHPRNFFTKNVQLAARRDNPPLSVSLSFSRLVALIIIAWSINRVIKCGGGVADR